MSQHALKTPAPASLQENIAAYKKMKEELKKHHRLKWVIFYDTEFIGAYDDSAAAARVAISRFGRGPYLIRQVDAPPRTLLIPVTIYNDD